MWGREARRGIATSIVILLLVAIAVAMAAGFAAYVLGLWGGIGGSMERLVVYGDSKLVVDNTNGQVYALVRLYADIRPSVTVLFMDIGKYRSTNIQIVEVIQGDPQVIDGKLYLPAGSYAVVRFDFPSELTDGLLPQYWGIVEGRMVTENGYLYKVELKVEYR